MPETPTPQEETEEQALELPSTLVKQIDQHATRAAILEEIFNPYSWFEVASLVFSGKVLIDIIQEQKFEDKEKIEDALIDIATTVGVTGFSLWLSRSLEKDMKTQEYLEQLPHADQRIESPEELSESSRNKAGISAAVASGLSALLGYTALAITEVKHMDRADQIGAFLRKADEVLPDVPLIDSKMAAIGSTLLAGAVFFGGKHLAEHNLMRRENQMREDITHAQALEEERAKTPGTSAAALH